ncbi:MAG: substrate-binding domain-containing protein, partial [Candidatus Hydrothermarchaeaceae archaeon]
SCRMALPEYDEESNVLATHVAWDALVFITHKDNPVDGITTQQAKDIILGDITNWKEVGGPDEKIIPVFREQTASGKISGVGHDTRVLLFDNPDQDYQETAIFKKSTGPVEEFITVTPYTFAVDGISSAKKRDLKILALDGAAASKENIGSGLYPYYRPLFIMTKGEPTGKILDFVDWILGPDGQTLISEQGTVNLEEGEGLKEKYSAWHDTDRIRNY